MELLRLSRSFRGKILFEMEGGTCHKDPRFSLNMSKIKEGL